MFLLFDQFDLADRGHCAGLGLRGGSLYDAATTRDFAWRELAVLHR